MAGMNRPYGCNPLMLWVLIFLLWGLPTLSLGQTGVLGGSVWFDENGNGIRELNESPLAGWPIHLQSGQQSVTQLDGSYVFPGLPAGEYTLTQGKTADWQQSFPQSDTAIADRFNWSRQLVAEQDGYVVSVAMETDPNGATYVGGIFSGTVDLDPGETVSLHAESGAGAFLVKLDAHGSYEWSRVTSVGESGRITGIAQDVNGVYVVGHFQSATLGFNDDVPGDAVVNPGFYSLFVAHFKRDGSHGWTRVVGGPGSMTLGSDVAVDLQGGLYVTGRFNRTVDFDPGPGTHTIQARDNELFLMKLDARDGLLAWVRTSRGLTLARGISLEVNPLQDTVLLTGAFRTYIDLYWGDGQAHLQSHGDWDTFSAAVTHTGDLVWAHTISGSYSIVPYDSAVDRSGNLYVTGMYTGSVDFDPGLGQDLRHYTNEAMGQSFLWKLDADGIHQWTQCYGSDQVGTAGTGVTTDAMGHVYCVGEVTEAVVDPNLVSNSDLFLAVYDDQGQMVSSSTLRGLYPSEVSDHWLYSFTPQLWRVACHPSGTVAVTGALRDCVDLDPGVPEVIHCTQPGAVDAFILHFHGFSDAPGWTVQLGPGQILQGLDFASYPVDATD